MLTAAEQIRILLIRKNMTLSELADKIEISRQNLSNKMKRDNFAEKEMMEIAEALGCSLEINFIDKKTGERLTK
jgi:transcriptional regulator with XRE-family HTH domain